MELKTPLYDAHVKAGGKIVEFGGYLLPVQYGTGVIKEHMSVRTQAGLFDLVFVNLPEVGDTVEAGEVFGDVESVKAVSDVYSPVTGEVTEINEELLDSPELINDDAYEAWFIKVKDVSATEELLTAEEYKAFVESEQE